MKRYAPWAVAALAVVVIGLFALSRNGPAPPHHVGIAVNIPLTGPVASFSGAYGNALQMGIEDGLREEGLPTDAVSVDLQDNAGSPAQAISVMQRQLSNGFDLYVSGVSQMSTAVARQVDATGSPHLLVSYDDALTAGASNRLRLLPNFKLEGPIYAQYARLRNARRVFAFTLNNPEIQAEFNKFVQGPLQQQGVAFTREIYEFGQSDFSTVAARVRAQHPDLIMVSGFSLHVLPIIRALRTQGLIQDGNVIAIMDFNELLTNGTPRSDLTGVAFIAPPILFPENDGAREAWYARYRARFHGEPNFIPAYAYDTGRIIARALHREGAVSRTAILHQLPYDGVVGRIAVDAEGDLSTPLGVLLVTSDGSLRRVELPR